MCTLSPFTCYIPGSLPHPPRIPLLPGAAIFAKALVIYFAPFFCALFSRSCVLSRAQPRRKRRRDFPAHLPFSASHAHNFSACHSRSLSVCVCVCSEYSLCFRPFRAHCTLCVCVCAWRKLLAANAVNAYECHYYCQQRFVLTLFFHV